MGVTTTYVSTGDLTSVGNYAPLYSMMREQLEMVTHGVQSRTEQIGRCTTATGVGLSALANASYPTGYYRYVSPCGFAIKFDSDNVSLCMTPDQIIHLYGTSNVVYNYHYRIINVDDYYKRLVITDYEFDTATFQLNPSGELTDPNYIYGFTDNRPTFSYGYDKNAARYVNRFIPNHEYSLSYAAYLKKLYKKKYKEDFTPLYHDSKAEIDAMCAIYYPQQELYFDDCYVSILPIIKDYKDDIATNIINGGKWDDATVETPPDISTDWKVYVDGTKLPNLKIVWHNADIETKDKVDNVKIKIQCAYVDGNPETPGIYDRGDEYIKDTDYTPYTNGNYKLSYKTLYEHSWDEGIDDGINAILPKKPCWIVLSLEYYNEVTEVLPSYASQKMCALIGANADIGYHGVWTDETDNSTISIIVNGEDIDTGETIPDSDEDTGYSDPTDTDDGDLADGQNNSIGVLTTTYKMTRERLNQLGGFLWSGNIFDEFSLINSNPIENIISCKNIPIDKDGADEIIHLGNVDTGVNGAKVTSNFGEISIGSYTIPKKYNSFLDLAPYTKVTIYLPYIGFKEIDSTMCVGKTINVKYVVDVLSGGCLVEVFLNGTRFYEFSGQMGIDIPITASNRAQVEGAYISNAVGIGCDLIGGDINGVADSIISSAVTKYKYSSTDKPNASCVASANKTCYVIIERPTYDNLKMFNHTKGRMCNLSKKIGNLKGYTKCDSNIDLSGIVATDAEKNEIVQILSNGFFA